MTDVSPALFNIEAEQCLLGALLVNNEVLERVSGIVHRDDFHDPVHARIFEVISDVIRRDAVASPVTLKPYFADDPGLAEIGGVGYIVRLAGSAISLFACKDYARIIANLSRKRRLAETLQQAMIDINDPDKDAAAVLGAVEAHSLTEEARGKAEVISFTKALTGALTGAKEAHEGGATKAMPSGLRRLDEMIGGFHPGDLVILGGRPGMGKSSLALSIALNAARAGRGIAFASLEMPTEALAQRALSAATDWSGRGVPYTAMRKGTMTDEEFEQVLWSAQEIRDLPIRFSPPSLREVGELYAAVKRTARQFEAKGIPFGAVIVDYLQLLRASRNTSRFEIITEISIALKQMALQLGVPVIALSQLSRGVEQRDDKRPIMSDLRESGQLEQDADLILFCYREEYYLRQEQPDGEDHDEMQAWREALSRAGGWMDIIVAKNRMGETGGVRARFDERFGYVRGGAA